MTYLSKAIWKLRPSAQFSFQDEDYSTIQWDVLEGTAPTQTEIDAAIEQVKLEEVQAETVAQAQKQAILDRLGLTEDELRIVLS